MDSKHTNDNFTSKYRYDLFEPSHQKENIFEPSHQKQNVFGQPITRNINQLFTLHIT